VLTEFKNINNAQRHSLRQISNDCVILDPITVLLDTSFNPNPGGYIKKKKN
jgi:hypothetical protein